MNIALIGYRGSGKSTVGPLLAERLGYGFFEADQRVVESAGKTIKDIFAQHGEEHFRDLESAVIADIAGLENHVISLGGGAVLRPANRQAITHAAAHIFYLRTDPEHLLNRIRNDPQTAANRPNLTNLVGGLDEIRSVLTAREPIYRQVMTTEIDVTQLTPEQAAAAILNIVR